LLQELRCGFPRCPIELIAQEQPIRAIGFGDVTVRHDWNDELGFVEMARVDRAAQSADISRMSIRRVNV
jgi:hypothetical protein